MNSRMPEWEPIPAWYRLSFKSPSTLVITIHNMAMTKLRSMDYAKTDAVKYLREKFRLDTFIPPTESSWGFGRMTLWGPEAVFNLGKSSHSEWTTWECSLPVRKDEGDDYQKFTEVRASLLILFLGLQVFGFDIDTKWKTPQLMIIQSMSLEHDLHGGSIWATLTPEMMKFVGKQAAGTQFVEIERAMYRASQHMFASILHEDKRSYRARCWDSKKISLEVPGNACDLSPSDIYDKDLQHGYTLCPHNVDSSFQQLAFLIGLAKLHELAQKDLYKKRKSPK